jgi:hypothetical protein
MVLVIDINLHIYRVMRAQFTNIDQQSVQMLVQSKSNAQVQLGFRACAVCYFMKIAAQFDL